MADGDKPVTTPADAGGPQGTGNVIAGIFSTLSFERILGAPLAAVIEAAKNNAKLYAEFIDSCMDEKGTPKTVTFTRKEMGNDGKEIYRQVEVPLLAIVEHPNLVIDEFTNEFTLEISDSFTQNVDAKLDGSASAKVGWGPFSVGLEAKFSAAYAQTRATNSRAKQHCIVKAHQAGPTEGMMKVMDWLTDGLGKAPASYEDPQKKAA